MTLKFDGWYWKTKGHLFYATLSFVHHFKPLGEFKLELQSGNAQFGSKSTNFLSCVTSKFDGWPWKTIGHLFYVASSFMHHFIAIGEFKLKLQSGNTQFGSKSAIFLSRVTFKFNRWTCKIIWQLSLATSSFMHHFIIICGHLHGHHFCLSMIITPENFVMIQWQEHSEKDVTDRQTDRETDGQKEVFLELLGRS